MIRLRRRGTIGREVLGIPAEELAAQLGLRTYGQIAHDFRGPVGVDKLGGLVEAMEVFVVGTVHHVFGLL